MKTRLIIEPLVYAGSVIPIGRQMPVPYAGAILSRHENDRFDLQSNGYHPTIRSAVEEIADTVVWCLGREWGPEE